MASVDALELRMADGGHEHIRAAGAVEEELDSFLAGKGGYAGEWVRVEHERYVRRSAILSVKIVRSVDLDSQGVM